MWQASRQNDPEKEHIFLHGCGVERRRLLGNQLHIAYRIRKHIYLTWDWNVQSQSQPQTAEVGRLKGKKPCHHLSSQCFIYVLVNLLSRGQTTCSHISVSRTDDPVVLLTYETKNENKLLKNRKW